MPGKRRAPALYQRGPYSLHQRDGRKNLEIIWYDPAARRERSASAGTGDVREARAKLDKFYLESQGQKVCQSCGRPFDGHGAQLLTKAISDYLVLSVEKPSYHAIQSRLNQVLDYLEAKGLEETVCAQVDQRWADSYRTWARKQSYTAGSTTKLRTPATVEASVAQLAAAITATQPTKALFKPIPLKTVNRTPTYRADVKTLAAMFEYCLRPKGPDGAPVTPKQRKALLRQRANLLNFLRASVATWARPDAVHDIDTSPARRQWFSQAKVLALNPDGRDQTKKYRPQVPIAHQFAPHLDACKGQLIPVNSVRKAWEAMAAELDLPTDREAGMKLIRRTMATLGRKKIGEANWEQGRMMLGHVKFDMSEIYAFADPANLGLALKATEEIIDEIEAMCAGAFHRTFTAQIKAIPKGRTAKNR